MYIIKEYLRKFPRFFKLLSWTKEKMIDPFTTGFVWNYFWFKVKAIQKEKAYLRKKNFQNIEVYKPRSWRFHEGIDGASRRYYKALFNGKVCFIKIADHDKTIENEINIGNYIRNYNFSFSPDTIFIDENGYAGGKILAQEYIDGLHEFVLPEEIDDFADICKEYLHILETLEQADIVHSDVHYRNLLIDSQGHLKLLDYGISIIKNKGNNIDYVARPGTFFIEKDQVRIYDDAYSFVKMVQKMSISNEFSLNNEFCNIKNRIGHWCNIVKIGERCF